MPRSKYPSDHRRYFRVMEDILDDPKLAECPTSACWLFVQILAMLNRSKSRDGVLFLPARAINSLTGHDRGATDSLLTRLQDAQILQFERQGKSTCVRVHNWAKHQGFAPAELRRNSVQTPHPSPNPLPNPTPTPNTKKVAPTGAPVCLAPERLSTEHWESLLAWGRGESPPLSEAILDQAWERVRDWSHTNNKKRARWWLVTKNAVKDGWALRGTTGANEPRSFAEIEATKIDDWLTKVSEEEQRGHAVGGGKSTGGSVRRLPERH